MLSRIDAEDSRLARRHPAALPGAALGRRPRDAAADAGERGVDHARRRAGAPRSVDGTRADPARGLRRRRCRRDDGAPRGGPRRLEARGQSRATRGGPRATIRRRPPEASTCGRCRRARDPCASALPTVPATHEDAPALRALAAILAPPDLQHRALGPRTRLSGQRALRAVVAKRLAVHRIVPDEVRVRALRRSTWPWRRSRSSARMVPPRARWRTPSRASTPRSAGPSAAASDRPGSSRTLEAQGIDLDYYEALRRAYAAIDADTLKAAAVRHLDPERLLVLCVGDVEAMKGGDGQNPQTLADLGEMTVHPPRRPSSGRARKRPFLNS